MIEKNIDNKMTVLVTAGDTSEKIDSVRSIVNTSSGKLGSMIADAFSMSGATVVYLCSRKAIRPNIAVDETIFADDVTSLYDAIEDVMSRKKIDCVIHAMAVSDYKVASVSSFMDIATIITSKIVEQKDMNFKDETNLTSLIYGAIKECNISINNNDDKNHDKKKISSDMKDLMIMLEQAPKIISRIKVLQPETILVGFKLLVGVDESELIDVAFKLLKKNKCTLVLANDLEKITKDNHIGLLVDEYGAYKKSSTKAEIADTIVSSVMRIKQGRVDS